MKKVLIPLFSLAALMGAQQAMADDAAARAVFQSKCTACHQETADGMGPGFHTVAARYAGNDEAVAILSKSIQFGSMAAHDGQMSLYGAGMPLMPPNPVTEEEAKLLAEWVMTH